MHNRQSNKQVFFSLEFVNILLQMEAKAVKKMRLHFFTSAVIANSKMDYSPRTIALSRSVPSLLLQLRERKLAWVRGWETRSIKDSCLCPVRRLISLINKPSVRFDTDNGYFYQFYVARVTGNAIINLALWTLLISTAPYASYYCIWLCVLALLQLSGAPNDSFQ